MSYKLNKTDGSLLVDLVDGQLDTSSSDLTLIGRNYSGFGEVLNENFIQLLENFANTSAPTNPIRGQLWYDTSENRLKVYNGSAFTASGGTTVSNQQPNMVAGDLWINSDTSQLYFFDGTNLRLVGPVYSNQQGTSGFQVASIIDTQNVTQHVVKMFVAGTLVGVHSNVQFTPVVTARIQELVTGSNPLGTVQKGFNTVGTGYKYIGTSTVSEALIDDNGVVRSGSGYLASDSDDLTVGALSIQNNAGLTIGLNNNTKLQFTNNAFTIANQLSNQDVEIKVRTPAEVSAFKIDTSATAVGIYKANPTATLHVGGNTVIDGNLTVGGTTTSIDVQNLKVEDKEIELNITSTGITTNDAGADGGGIRLKSTDGDKTFIWNNGTDAWTSSEYIDLAAGKGYKINTNTVLTQTSLGASVISAPGLTSIGTLTSLVVDDVQIDGSKVFTTASALQLQSPQPIAVQGNQRITGVGSPVNASDVATKEYTDGSTIISLQLDVSNFTQNAAGNNYLNTREVLEKLYPVAGYNSGSTEPPLLVPGAVIPARNQGALARVLTVDYGSGGGFTIPTINFTPYKNFTQVDQTITIMQRTIASITTGEADPTLGTTTKITTTASHYYEGLQQVVITGTVLAGSGGLPATIDGNYTIQAAEISAESPNFVSFTIDLDTSALGWASNAYTPNSGTVQRTPVVGAANKQVLEDISNPTSITGTINFAPTRRLLQFVVNNGAWAFDREITLTLTP